MNFWKLFWLKCKNFLLYFWQFFNSDYWLLKEYDLLKEQVLKFRQSLQNCSDQDLQKYTPLLKKEYAKHRNLTNLLVKAYGVAFEAVFRITGLTLHPVQVLGAIVLHFGDVAEMKTGEGKTLTSVLPAYLNALTGRQVCIVTVNEYLVNRDFVDNGKIFHFLGISVGKTLNQMTRQEKLANYAQTIVYGTNSEFGFDYLRDNMLQLWEKKLQQEHYYVIIDEVDSVLIDEGRTPLIISGRPRNRSNFYQKVDQFVKSLKAVDFKIDPEFKRCFLQKSGILKANHFFQIKSLFDLENSELFHFVSNALQANYILKKNIDYLIKDRKVVLVDQFTGRVTPDRTLSEGLHQALEAKESCSIREESAILATITYQNFFRLFDKISGMTGTAKTEEDEFISLFNMHVLQIPTDQPMIRFDDQDFFFYDKKHKYLALAKRIQQLHENNQPILIGTSSVRTSEEFSVILRKFGFNFRVLNAKHHEHEAKLIANAGHHRQITISTNMAGRGTDIKLDEIAKKSGGLAVLAVERNESRRIDLQLQGRSGRQGEPGYSAFYLSLDDDLFLRFGNRRFKKIFASMGEEVLKSGLLSSAIAKYQKKIQIANYEQRKSLLEHDNVISQQMRVVYRQRDFIVQTKDFDRYLKNTFMHCFLNIWNKMFSQQLEVTYQEVTTFFHHLQEKIALPDYFLVPFKNSETFTQEETINHLVDQAINFVKKVQQLVTNTKIDYFPEWMYQLSTKEELEKHFLFLQLKNTVLRLVDHCWTTHLDELFRLKAGSFLSGYGQKSPLQAFIENATLLFNQLKEKIVFQTTIDTFKLLNENFQHLQKKVIS